MSKRTELKASMERSNARVGGAHLTREARSKTFKLFIAVLFGLGFQIADARQVGGRHLPPYVAARLAAGKSKRTIQNEMAHIRAVLRDCGKTGLADDPHYSNKALGIGGASRGGTKTPISEEGLAAFKARVEEELGRPGLAAGAELQYAIGLRAKETIMGGRTDVLERWAKELGAGDVVDVVEGTKGGRPRQVKVHDRARAVAAVNAALKLAERQDGFLVPSKNGLKSALGAYRNVAHREGFQTHRCRYTFTDSRVDAYQAAGYSKREAFERTGTDLGHRDGRGRMIKGVYYGKGRTEEGDAIGTADLTYTSRSSRNSDAGSTLVTSK